jgi:glycosyltransferase involved in cell wall biosynthesis
MTASILLLSRYSRLGASSRIRSLQYLPYLRDKNWEIDVSPLFSNSYIRAIYNNKLYFFEALRGYLKRFRVLFLAKRYDLVWIEKEILPFFPDLAERLLSVAKIPYVVDFDDAIFHRYDQHRLWLVRLLLGSKIDNVMKYAAVVIAGNEYLANRAMAAGAKRVEVIPTVLDLNRYNECTNSSNNPVIVGWIGTPATSHYLSPLLPVFKALKKNFDVRFVAIGANKELFENSLIEIWPWTEETEVNAIQAIDIGIMPLTDSPWERGKCGYKLIQYMACGKPVIASPIGVNKELIVAGINGYFAETQHEWYHSLATLITGRLQGTQMGKNGRERIKNVYSLQVQAPRLESIMRSVSSK